MPRENKSKKDPSNLEKIKNEMRRKRQKAEALSKTMGDMEIMEIPDEGSAANEEHELQAPPARTAASGAISAAKEIAPAVAAPSDNTLKLVVFKLGIEQFAFKLMNVREIVRFSGLRAVPLAPAHIAGLCSVRGTILPVIDIRKCFHMPFKEYDDDSKIIVADLGGRQVGLIADQILEVTSVEASAVVEPPSHLKNKNNEHERYVTGIMIKSNGIIMILDLEKIINNY